MITLIALVVLPYVVFVFFAESLNPLVKPHLHSNRSQWRHGRRMALAAFVGVICSLVLLEIGSMSSPAAIGTGVATGVVLGLCFSAKKIGNVLRH